MSESIVGKTIKQVHDAKTFDGECIEFTDGSWMEIDSKGYDDTVTRERSHIEYLNPFNKQWVIKPGKQWPGFAEQRVVFDQRKPWKGYDD